MLHYYRIYSKLAGNKYEHAAQAHASGYSQQTEILMAHLQQNAPLLWFINSTLLPDLSPAYCTPGLIQGPGSSNSKWWTNPFLKNKVRMQSFTFHHWEAQSISLTRFQLRRYKILTDQWCCKCILSRWLMHWNSASHSEPTPAPVTSSSEIVLEVKRIGRRGGFNFQSPNFWVNQHYY